MPFGPFSLSTILGVAGVVFAGLGQVFPNQPWLQVLGAGLASILMPQQPGSPPPSSPAK